MSVGKNITDALARLVATDTRLSQLNVLNLPASGSLCKPGIYHALSGKNGSPGSKCSAFLDTLRKTELGSRLDAALFKFCFVDFDRHTNVKQIFDRYVATIDSIEHEFPNLVLVHVTVPLTVHSWGFRGIVRNVLKDDIQNVKRNRFNELLRNKYGSRNRLYDLARLESTANNGKRVTFGHEGRRYYSMNKSYSTDGGHLNESGSTAAAIELLNVLAGMDYPEPPGTGDRQNDYSVRYPTPLQQGGNNELRR